jgi:hypothetical protein
MILCNVTSARILEDELVKRVRSYSCNDVGQRSDSSIPAPIGSCPPDRNCNQTPTDVAGGVCGHLKYDKKSVICISEQKCDYAQPLLANPQIAVPLEKNCGVRSTTVITGRNYLLCQADNPGRSDRRSEEVRRIKTRGNHYADEEVLFPEFEAFQSWSAI